MSDVLFIGPSLYGHMQHVPPGIACRPPAGRGDVMAAVQDGARRIGLVDGVFGQVPSVWHKEILWALSQGVAVLGAASMGALRAAECAEFGMVGIGGIWRDYATGRRRADADVAVLHGPAEVGHVPLTVALVDALDAIDRLRRSGRLDGETAWRLRSAARSQYFGVRTWARMCRQAGVDVDLPAGPLRKARDALALVRALPDAAVPAPLGPPPWTRDLHSLAAHSRT